MCSVIISATYIIHSGCLLIDWLLLTVLIDCVCFVWVLVSYIVSSCVPFLGHQIAQSHMRTHKARVRTNGMDQYKNRHLIYLHKIEYVCTVVLHRSGACFCCLLSFHLNVSFHFSLLRLLLYVAIQHALFIHEQIVVLHQSC